MSSSHITEQLGPDFDCRFFYLILHLNFGFLYPPLSSHDSFAFRSSLFPHSFAFRSSLYSTAALHTKIPVMSQYSSRHIRLLLTDIKKKTIRVMATIKQATVTAYAVVTSPLIPTVSVVWEWGLCQLQYLNIESCLVGKIEN